MFQEGEKLCIDCLFWVRVKQPFAKSLQDLSGQKRDSIAPSVDGEVSLGDVCAFKFDGKPGDGDNSRIGRIIQFSNYKEKLKKDRQYKPDYAEVNLQWEDIYFAPGIILLLQIFNVYCICHRQILGSYFTLKTSVIYLYNTSWLFCCSKGTNIKEIYFGALPAHSTVHTASELMITRNAYDFVC